MENRVTKNMSIVDIIKTVIIDPSLETENTWEIFKGILNLDQNPLTIEFTNINEEELKIIISEFLTLCVEVEQPQLIPLVNELMFQSLSFIDADNYYTDMIFSNPNLDDAVITMIVRSDPNLSIPEVLIHLIKTNVVGSRQYAFEKLRNFIREPFLQRQSLVGLIQLASDAGDEEGYGFLKDVLTSRYRVSALEGVNVSRIEYLGLLDEECRALSIYNNMINHYDNVRDISIDKLPNIERFAIIRLIKKISGMEEIDNQAFEDLVKEGVLNIKHIRFLELMNWIESNDILQSFYGPYNPERVMRTSVFGSTVSQIPELPEDPRENFMLHGNDWYKGVCDHCLRAVVPKQKSFRTPLIDGGWEGCYCSPTCSIKNTLYTKYKIPRHILDTTIESIERQFKSFFMDINVSYYNGYALLLRDYPAYQTNDDGEFYDRRGLRHPKIIVKPATEIVRPQTTEPELEGVDEILSELGLDSTDLGLMKDEGEVITYTKEVILSEEDIETYGLTNIMAAKLGGITLIIPHPH